MVVETRSVAKRRRLMNEGQDRISELPDDILHSILHLLPIKSVAQTVVLSRRWRNVFSSVLDLDFISLKFPRSVDFIINRVLSQRDKSSSIRTLKLKSRLKSNTLKCLIRCAKTNNIQELELGVNGVYHSTDLPWEILTNCGSSLKVLRVSRMNLILSPTQTMNRGFKWLHTITLSDVMTEALPLFTDSMFPSLKKLTLRSFFPGSTRLNISCSGLEDLVIKQCIFLNSLDIYGLKLERLDVTDSLNVINHNTPAEVTIIAPVLKYLKWVGMDTRHIPLLEMQTSLDRADIVFVYVHDDMIPPEQGLNNMMIALSHVKTLKFQCPSQILKTYFANKYERLTLLEINTSMNFEGFATLFKNCPYLHTLVITISYMFGLDPNQGQLGYGDDKFWEDQIPQLISFLNHLKMVKFFWFYEKDKQVCSLAKFLLLRGKVLEKMIFYVKENSYDFTLPYERINPRVDLSGLSSKVEVIFY